VGLLIGSVYYFSRPEHELKLKRNMLNCPKMKNYMIGSIVGPPGSGKTTQGDFIEENYCICQFEIGKL
jgi:hypothetical protein